jgi:hypothetical protein
MAQPIEATHSKAMDAASKLAADVNAAAEALDNLKRLLQRQVSNPVQARLRRARERYLEAAPIQPWQPPPMSEHALPQVPVTPILPGDLAHAVEPRRLDIRTFLAGFALSAAIGALLYIFLAAG